MRLLNTSTLKIEEFFGNAIPLYAILSHTWSAEEVTLQDMLDNTPFHKKGFQKLIYSCTQARSDGLAYIWIDTCCIDKTSSAELSEAINSMYRWYNESVYCYIYLSDVPDTTDPSAPGSSFRESKWFTRGWTLQELVAPERRIFFSASWKAIGCVNWESWKQTQSGRAYETGGLPELEMLLAEITGIDIGVLKGSRLSDVSIARRMSWAAKRKTTRTEDIAYCLMGIFDVNMPLLYGEGGKAFIRLQEEILKSSDDESLFAHSIPSRQPKFDSLRFSSLLAQSPACFSGWANIGMCRSASRGLLASSVPASLTSKGLRVRLPLCYNIGYSSEFNEDVVLALLDCKVGEDGLARLSIPLVRLPYSRDQYLRLDPNSLRVLSPRDDGPGSASLVVYRSGEPQEGSKRYLFNDCLSSIPEILSAYAKLC
jgi:hypothetical protein